MPLATRKPTGRPSWPILLLAGREGAGKTFAALSASASPLVGRALYIGVGEDDPDEYSMIPGVDFDIVVHDGTYPGILNAIKAAAEEPSGDHPNLIVVDSMSRLWTLIQDNVQAIANKRAKGRRNANGDFTISMDLWNLAADQWNDVMNAIRLHQGPVVLTARLDPVTVMENGQPTGAKEWKVQAHKSLVFDAAGVVEMRERGQFLITKLKSIRVMLEGPRQYPGFTVAKLWNDLGLGDGVGERGHATVVPDTTGAEVDRVTSADRVRSAVAAVRAATSADKLDEIEAHAKKLGIDGVAPLPEELAAKRAELGTSADAWAPSEPLVIAKPGVTA
ncbi:AAA family ATPase [Microbacterium testaceum]|uniref:AAA family ATPase n=1 Tax=Microbacterium testaceum TaxID=2033 RepID=UPI000734343F|nr:AAA family ATPase [Microbacterium testaceum]